MSTADFVKFESQREVDRLREILERAHEKASEAFMHSCGGDAGRLRTLIKILNEGLKNNG